MVGLELYATKLKNWRHSITSADSCYNETGEKKYLGVNEPELINPNRFFLLCMCTGMQVVLSVGIRKGFSGLSVRFKFLDARYNKHRRIKQHEISLVWFYFSSILLAWDSLAHFISHYLSKSSQI